MNVAVYLIHIVELQGNLNITHIYTKLTVMTATQLRKCSEPKNISDQKLIFGLLG